MLDAVGHAIGEHTDETPKVDPPSFAGAGLETPT
jgi:hypothetical protein